MALVSVIIASFNGEKFLENCLNSLLAEKESFEVVVVENGSNDNSLNLLKKKFSREPRLKTIILEQNQGAAQARNLGVRASSGQYLFFLDNDTRVKSGWLKTIPEFFKNHPRCGLAQTKILKMGTDQFDSAGELLTPLGFLAERARGTQDLGQFDKAEPIFGLKTAGAIMRRSVFEKIEGFDPDYWLYWEDADLAWRTWLAGWQVLFCPGITVWHAFGTDQKNENFYQKQKRAYPIVYSGCKNHLVTILKNFSLKSLALSLPAVVFAWSSLAILFLLRRQPTKTGAILAAFLWNLKHFGSTLTKRKKIQAQRKISENELFSLVGKNHDLRYYLGKALAYLNNKPF